MKLFMVHCGFYDADAGDGTYELHTNFFTVAEDFKSAKKKVKALPEFKKRHMHVDGIQAIEKVDGFRIEMDKERDFDTVISAWSYDDLN